MSEQAKVICGEVEAFCRCTQQSNHECGHVCDCGGSWLRADGKFQFLAFPGSNESFEWQA